MDTGSRPRFFRHGLTLPEIVIAATLLGLIGAVIFGMVRQAGRDHSRIHRTSWFFQEIGLIEEYLKNDLRAVRVLEVAPQQLTLERFAGLGEDGRLATETVIYVLNQEGVVARRPEGERRFRLIDRQARPAEKLVSEFQLLWERQTETARRGVLAWLARIEAPAGSPVPQLVASLTIEFTAEGISVQ